MQVLEEDEGVKAAAARETFRTGSSFRMTSRRWLDEKDEVEELPRRWQRLLQEPGEAEGRHHQEGTFQQVRSNYSRIKSSLRMRVVIIILSPSLPLVLQLFCRNNNRKLIA